MGKRLPGQTAFQLLPSSRLPPLPGRAQGQNWASICLGTPPAQSVLPVPPAHHSSAARTTSDPPWGPPHAAGNSPSLMTRKRAPGSFGAVLTHVPLSDPSWALGF